MERNSSRREPTLRIETEAEQPSLVPEELEVKALRDRNLLQETIDHKVTLVSAHQKNNRETVRRLRQLAAEELELFGLEEDKQYDIAVIISELVTNTFRYSTGPLWVSIVKSTIHATDPKIQVITVTVANELGEGATTKVEYEGAVAPEEDGLPEVPVHGRGMPIIEGTAAEHGEFEVEEYGEQRKKLLGTYAVIGFTAADDADFKDLRTAA